MAERQPTVRVLVVEDSRLAASAMGDAIEAEPGLSLAAIATDPFEAARVIAREVPDVMVLDLELPRMDGVTFLRKVMAQHPIPTVVCSGTARSGSERAVQALQAGAVTVVDKQSVTVVGEQAGRKLIDGIFLAARARRAPVKPLRDPSLPPQRQRQASSRYDVICVGASTGGTDAVTRVLRALPREVPGIVIVQHLPANFTEPFARALDAASRLDVSLARHGDQVAEGRVLVAPGGRQLRLQRVGTSLQVAIGEATPIKRHCPAVEALFSSAAEQVGARAVGVMLTGMGDDGAQGMLAMRQRQAFTIAQDQASCVVYGMPKAAVDAGAVVQILPLSEIPRALARAVFSREPIRSVS